MRRITSLVAPLLVLSFVLWAGARLVIAEENDIDIGGHKFVQNQDECDMCHAVEWNGNTGKLDERTFNAQFNDVCAENCHPEELKRSHPVNVNPYKLVKREDYPKFLPLQYSEVKKMDILTCVTCHKPHGERLGRTKLHPRQREVPGSEGQFLTYYLRIRGFTPKDGYTPLCKSCHPNL